MEEKTLKVFYEDGREYWFDQGKAYELPDLIELLPEPYKQDVRDGKCGLLYKSQP